MATRNVFQDKIWQFYKTRKRIFPWRETQNPYHILVSEVMLQQTQTQRVIPKYQEFLQEFPTLSSLSHATMGNVLRAWSGLGYNRRALYLKKVAEKVRDDFNGKFPLDPHLLQSFSGIGPNTAGAIYVFSTNKPYVFIETNIRRVFIHEFFKDKEKISDEDILRLIKRTLDKNNPREWYYALMDYGAFLSKTETNPNRKSKHYKKQTTFKGSLRQARGTLLKILLKEKSVKTSDLKRMLGENFETAFSQLKKEGFITEKKGSITLQNT